MNSLNRNLVEGEKVVLKAEVMSPEYRALEHRTVTVLGGFGMSANTRGTALMVQFADGERARFEGYEIDPVATAAQILDLPA